MKSSTSWDIESRSLVKVNRYFGRIYRFHLQAEFCLLPALCWFLIGLTLRGMITYSSETFHRTKWCYIPEDRTRSVQVNLPKICFEKQRRPTVLHSRQVFSPQNLYENNLLGIPSTVVASAWMQIAYRTHGRIHN
jgi:hypothetical protein